MKTALKLTTCVSLIVVIGILADWNPVTIVQFGKFISQAEARVGRPATPGSVAGVARRTTRRAIRRSTVYRATLPRSCTVVVIDGISLWLCGSTYYQSYNSQYVVVYIH